MRDQLRHLAIEERQQQRGDMRAVDVGVGHHDHALVAQILVAIFRARAAAERLHQIGEFLVLLRACPPPALATFRILPRSGRMACVARSRACLAEPPALSPSTRKISVPFWRVARAVGELAGQAQLARRGFALRLLFLPPLEPVLGLVDDEVEKLVGFLRVLRQPVIEVIAHDVLDQTLRVGRRQLVLRLALEFRFADEHRQHRTGAAITSSVVISAVLRLLCARHARAAPCVSALRRPCSCVPPCEVGIVLQ